MNAVPVPFAQYSVLVAGAGSIGRRHMANLRQLGTRRLAVTDPDASRLQPIVNELGLQGFANFEEALCTFKPDVVLVCTPPVYHVEQALRALRSGADVFIEKPLSNRLDGVGSLQVEAAKLRRVVHVGYNLRFNPGIQTLKRLVEEGVAGRFLWARAEVAQYLPDWRPWQDYRQSYTARRELGGGIILDASHEIDYILWLLGPPRELTCMAGQVSGLETNVEDCATILIRLRSGAQADVHMDFAQRTAGRPRPAGVEPCSQSSGSYSARRSARNHKLRLRAQSDVSCGAGEFFFLRTQPGDLEPQFGRIGVDSHGRAGRLDFSLRAKVGEL